MKASRTRLASSIAQTTMQKGTTQKHAREIAAYLLAEGRVAELDSVLRDVQVAWAEAGHVEVIASTAHSLTTTVKADINKQVKLLYPNAQTIVVTEQHDPNVLGGVRLSVANRQLDISIEAKLNKFKQLTR